MQRVFLHSLTKMTTKCTIYIINTLKTVTDTYLTIPKSISGPQLIKKMHEVLSIIFVQALGIKYKMRTKVMVFQQITSPVPEQPIPNIKCMLLVPMQDQNHFLFELYLKIDCKQGIAGHWIQTYFCMMRGCCIPHLTNTIVVSD